MGKGRSSKPLNTNFSKVVLDASVILKTILPNEDESEKETALNLFQKYSQGSIDIFVPDFCTYEIGNTLARKLAPNKAALGFKFFLAQKFKVATFSKSQLLEIIAFCPKYNVSFYDASYHLLARFVDSVFITADKKYFEKFKGDKHIALVQNLKI